jgi:hypothetical protein
VGVAPERIGCPELMFHVKHQILKSWVSPIVSRET